MNAADRFRAFFSRFAQGASAKTVWGSMRAEQVPSRAARWMRPRSDPEYRKRRSDTGQTAENALETSACHIVALDYGIKFNTLRMLAQRGCRVTVLPAVATAADVLAHAPDGIFLSNGPGDPQSCTQAICIVREFIDRALPVFGLCL